MKLRNLYLMVVFGQLSLPVFSDNVSEAAWGVKELEQAALSANVAFLEKHGATLHAAISGFAIERTVQGNAAKAKVSYKDATGTTVTASFFCHLHRNDIDCH